MNENQHKALLEERSIRRWIKTNPAGWFGFDTPSVLAKAVALVEGGFDRLSLMAAGLPASAVMALVGTAARPAWLLQLAPQVRGVVLALDADAGGIAAMERLADEFRRAGLAVALCPLPNDAWGKDWSERFRRIGQQCVWPLYEALARVSAEPHR
jgi:DNA primase